MASLPPMQGPEPEPAPTWAIKRAIELAGVTKDGRDSVLNAFARYIAEHEEEPPDPLEVLADKVATEMCEEMPEPDAYESYKAVALRALRAFTQGEQS